MPLKACTLRGPALVAVPVMAVRELSLDAWVADAGVPGIRVVEGPVSAVISGGSKGSVHVRVDLGSDVIVSAGCFFRSVWHV